MRKTWNLNRPTRRSVSAFTLVELLVVLAILAILISLLAPSLGRARDLAQSARCLSNLRQSGVAMLTRAGEHRGEIGLFVYQEDRNLYTPWHLWLRNRVGPDNLRPMPASAPGTSGVYLSEEDKNVMLCPAFFPYADDDRILINAYIYGALMRPASADDTGSFVPAGAEASSRVAQVSRIRDPGKYLLLTDSYRIDFTGGFERQVYVITDHGRSLSVHLRHNGRANTLFADGSVQGMTPEDLKNVSPIPFTGGHTAEGTYFRF